MSLAALLADDWPALNALLDEALALPAAERAAFIDGLGAEHASRRDTLRALLSHASHVETGDFLATLPAIGLPSVDASAAQPAPGAEVGPYRLIEEIGSGGMGAVWLAERADGSLKRKVALKLPRITWDLSFAQRSLRERDILAALEHPHIARLYDAGVDALGRPYLAMEYVRGQPIDAWCDARRLPLGARVNLLRQVADAVAYAHRRLVVHRDLKPSNILVTDDGQVRLLDFGIARLLAADGAPAADHTLAAPAFTVNYASPEQLQGQPLSTATDIYSLGVVAHELLGGVRPFDHLPERGVARVQAILAADLAPPSHRLPAAATAAARASTPAALQRALRGDLDAILLRALAREPEQRYPSAEALADDLARWRDGRPVSAQRPRAGYLLRKFVRRHRLAVGASAAAALALVVTTGVAVMQSQQAREQAQRAQASRDFLINLFERADPDLRGGRDATVRELLEPAEREAERLAPEQQREVMQTIAKLWVRFGDLDRSRQLQARVSELSERSSWARVASHLEESRLAMIRWQTDDAVRLLTAAEAAAPARPWPSDLRALAAELRGWTLYQRDQPAEAEPYFAVAREAGRGIGVREVYALYGLAEAQVDAGRWRAAKGTLGEVRALLSSADAHGIPEREQHELLAALCSGYYKMGLFASGWSVAEELTARAQAHYGGGLDRQLRYRLMWLRYAVRLKHTDAVARWIADQSNAEVPGYGVDRIDEIHWHTLVARAHANAGDAERSARALATARRLIGGVSVERRDEWQVRVDLAEADSALKLGDSARAMRVLRSWRESRSTPAGMQRDVDELSAVAAARLGRADEAQRLLRHALNASETHADVLHPDAHVMRLNELLLAVGGEDPLPAPAEIAQRLAAADAALAESYGASHHLAQFAARLRAAVPPPGTPGNRVTDRERLRLAAGPFLGRLAD